MEGRSTASLADQRARWWRWAAIALGLSLVAVLVYLLGGAKRDGPNPTPPLVGLAFAAYQLIGVGFALRASRHRDLDSRSRRAWGVMAIAYVMLGVSGALRPSFPAGVQFPALPDLLRLAFVPVMLIGLLVLPLRRYGHRERHKIWLDAAIVTVTGGMLLGYLEVGADVQDARRISGGALAVVVAYPALDLALIFGATVVLFRGTASSARGPAAVLGLAMIFIVAGDIYFGSQQSHLGGAPPDRWHLACWLTGHLLLAMAAMFQCQWASRHRIHIEEAGPRSISIVPYLAVALSYLLLLLAVRGQQFRIVGLVVGAIVITGIVVARQVSASRQNHELATTDPLTGLANRRHLADRLRLALVRSSRNGQSVAALLLDIEGFKQVNETMGHEAGDQLLITVGTIVRGNVLGRDVVGRWGGDEFAVLLHDIGSPANAVAVARRILAAMEAPMMIANTPMQPRAVIGVAVSGPGELSAEELLDDADLARAWAKRHTSADLATYQEYVEGSATARGAGRSTTGRRISSGRHPPPE